MTDYYVVLTGAKKNIGDFLITYRAEQLLKKIRPDRKLVKLNNWEKIDGRLELINNSNGLIILGGPGYQANMYPGIYKLVKDLKKIKVSIIVLGGGWKGIPGDEITLEKYFFSDNSKKLLERINKDSFLSCRDYYTKKCLENSGFFNITMTGCPAWYDLESLNKKMILPQKIEKIVFTPAQNIIFRNQSIEIMKLLKKKFPNSTIYCSFHRGINVRDIHTSKIELKNTKTLEMEAKKIGLIPLDTSYDLKKIDFYKDCDLHIGYRVHAHIYFLSKRKPSILLHEDGRGKALSEVLNILGIDAFSRTFFSRYIEGIRNKYFKVILKKILPLIKENKQTLKILDRYIEEEVSSGFLRFSGVYKIIDNYYKIMEEFIKKLP